MQRGEHELRPAVGGRAQGGRLGQHGPLLPRNAARLQLRIEGDIAECRKGVGQLAPRHLNDAEAGSGVEAAGGAEAVGAVAPPRCSSWRGSR